MAAVSRLAGPTALSTIATTLFTATERTVVRTMDVTATAATTWWVMLNSTTANIVWKNYRAAAAVTKDDYSASWRGGLVLETGDYLSVDADTTTAAITICGVVGA